VSFGTSPPPAVRRAADAFLALTVVSIPLSTTGMEAVVIGLGVLALGATLAGRTVVVRTPLDGVLALFYGVLALSTLASGHPLEAIGWAKLWIVLTYFGVFWWVRDGAHAGRLARLLVVAGTVSAAYGVLQHFTAADWYRHLLGRPTFVRARDAASGGYAVVGFFRNYLTFAHTMIFPFAAAAALAAAGRLLGFAAAVVIAVAIVFSTARGAWLALVAVAVVLALLAHRTRIVVMLGALVTAAVLTVAVTPALRAEAAKMFTRGGVNVGRMGIYAANLDIIHARPVFGLGFGRYQAAAGPYFDLHPEADRRSHAHNNFLQIAAEAGLAGLAAFGLVYAVALRRGLEAVRGAREPLRWATAAGALAGVVGFLIGGLTQYTFGDAEVAIAMWTALALSMRCRE